MTHSTAVSPFLNPVVLPLHSAETVAQFGSTLVVAPHPDDESLGCGGVIALLRSFDCAVSVLVISDGTRSHPRSRKYPALALRALRETETQSALAILGVEASQVTFLGLPDGAVPNSGAAGFEQAVARCCDCLAALAPKTIFLPWRLDPHPDHRAAWQLMRKVIADLHLAPIIVEYPIWDWDPEQRDSLPTPNQVTGWRLDISRVLELKLQAIATYRSQTTDLIDDDPEGFRLQPEMLANFAHPWEVFLEERR
ncbi:MAG: PIG-L family deacetylase [Chroococcidiopsidaceae cyanobacterium CP_BM_RX_35]|nr:PIG-L family deacetylase [Chroococcidiopsidaceae cyanobacterium CP_BM_RX_35]